MITVPISCDFLGSIAAQSMQDAELRALVLLLKHICCEQQYLPLDLNLCRVIANAHSRDRQRALDRVLAQHFYITEHGRKPHAGLIKLPGNVQFNGDDTVTGALRGRHADLLQDQLHDDQLRSDPKELARMRQKRRRLKMQQRLDAEERAAAPSETIGLDHPATTPPVTLNGHDAVTTALQERDSRAWAGARSLNTNTNTEEGRAANSVTNRETGGWAIRAMKEAGLPFGNPSNPTLLRLLNQGVTPAELADATRDVISRGKKNDLNYILAVVEGERRDAAAKAALPDKQNTLAQWAPSMAAAIRKAE